MFEAPFFPIVYVRGYAGTQAEVEDTVADPYMGFNLGSTKIRQTWRQDVVRHVFESPLIRLMKDHGYGDIYDHGAELPRSERPRPKSIWIYRYYEPISKELGTGRRPEMEDYAAGLYDFIEAMRDQYCGAAAPETHAARAAFRVYLVGHSMGGLVIRCYLQRIWREKQAEAAHQARQVPAAPPVDKVFTYATPHGGIDFRFVGNVPGFLKVNNVENFNEERMRQYLGLADPETPVQSLDGAFDPDRFFCLVGTNHRDYGVALGLSRQAVGPMSDGLVQIQNASVKGAPRAFVHRAHSGHYGIVNSEEGYQNLRRFLFGNVRVDGLLEIEELTLPPEVEARWKEKPGRTLRASYHVEVVARVRGARWDLHRRVVAEQSAIFCDYARYVETKKPVYLVSGYLLDAARTREDRDSLGFSLDLRVLVPEYVLDGFWLRDDHFEGGYLFRDKINLELFPRSGQPPVLKWGVDRRTPNRASAYAARTRAGDGYEFRIPVRQDSRPGLRGTLVFRSRPWG